MADTRIRSEKYVKLPHNLFEIAKIEELLQVENGDTLFSIWIKLVLRAKRVKNRRFIFKVANGVEITDSFLTRILRLQDDNMRYYLDELELREFITRSPDMIEVFRVWESPQRNRNTPEYIKWRETVFENDKYTCRHCHLKGGKLNAHHIVPWAVSEELRFSVDNGITLCIKCHRAVHKEEMNER